MNRLQSTRRSTYRPYRVKRLKPPHQGRKRLKSVITSRLFGIGILVLIIAGGIFYLVCFSSIFQIREIKISGNSKVSTRELQGIIQNQIEKKILLFSSKSIFLTDSNKINEIIVDKFPQIAKADLKRNFPDTILVEIEERKPAAIFYRGENQFFVDKEGIIFEAASETRPELLKIKSQNLKEELRLGEKVIEKEQLSQILDLEPELKNFKIPIKEFIIISEEELTVITAEGWEIYFNPQEDLEWQLTKLRALLEEEIPPEKRGDLEYINLRFGNLAPYKYKTTSAPPAEAGP